MNRTPGPAPLLELNRVDDTVRVIWIQVPQPHIAFVEQPEKRLQAAHSFDDIAPKQNYANLPSAGDRHQIFE